MAYALDYVHSLPDLGFRAILDLELSVANYDLCTLPSHESSEHASAYVVEVAT